MRRVVSKIRDLVSGWWFDGYKMEMKESYEALMRETHNIDSWVDAVLSGNPKAELAFNAGAHPILSLCTRGRFVPVRLLPLVRTIIFFQEPRRVSARL